MQMLQHQTLYADASTMSCGRRQGCSRTWRLLWVP